MVFNFRICGISRDARKLIKTLILIKKNKKKKERNTINHAHYFCPLNKVTLVMNSVHEFLPNTTLWFVERGTLGKKKIGKIPLFFWACT